MVIKCPNCGNIIKVNGSGKIIVCNGCEESLFVNKINKKIVVTAFQLLEPEEAFEEFMEEGEED